jgi:hypothetical protein
MAQFCEKCPDRGNCQPEQELHKFNLVLGDGTNHVYVTQFFDRQGNASEVFWTTDSTLDLEQQIGACEQPDITYGKIFRKRERLACAGLGSALIAATGSEIEEVIAAKESVLRQINAELWDEL